MPGRIQLPCLHHSHCWNTTDTATCSVDVFPACSTLDLHFLHWVTIPHWSTILHFPQVLHFTGRMPLPACTATHLYRRPFHVIVPFLGCSQITLFVEYKSNLRSGFCLPADTCRLRSYPACLPPGSCRTCLPAFCVWVGFCAIRLRLWDSTTDMDACLPGVPGGRLCCRLV